MTPVSSPTPDEQAAEGYESRPEIYTQPKLEYDVTVDAGYVKIQAGTVARTFAGPHGVNLDFDADGNLLGVELLGFRAKPEPLAEDARAVVRTWLRRHDYPAEPAWQVANLMSDLRAAFGRSACGCGRRCAWCGAGGGKFAPEEDFPDASEPLARRVDALMTAEIDRLATRADEDDPRG